MAAIRLEGLHVAHSMFLLGFYCDLGDWSNDVGGARVAGKHRPFAAATSKRCAICGERALRRIQAHRRSKWLRPHRF
jgi:hypothetical protein